MKLNGGRYVMHGKFLVVVCIAHVVISTGHVSGELLPSKTRGALAARKLY